MGVAVSGRGDDESPIPTDQAKAGVKRSLLTDGAVGFTSARVASALCSTTCILRFLPPISESPALEPWKSSLYQSYGPEITREATTHQVGIG